MAVDTTLMMDMVDLLQRVSSEHLTKEEILKRYLDDIPMLIQEINDLQEDMYRLRKRAEKTEELLKIFTINTK